MSPSSSQRSRSAKSRSPKASSDEAPRGREAVTEAIIGAASDLFSELPWDAVTLRAIADRAGVNYGLVHRHFGTRADVVRAVFEKAARDNSAAVADLDLPSALETIFSRSRSGMGRVIASALVAGESPSSLHDSFPTLHQLAEISARTPELRARTEPLQVDPRVFSGVLLACALGWWIFEPFLVAGLDLDQIDGEDLHRQVGSVLRLLASGSAAREPAEADGWPESSPGSAVYSPGSQTTR